MIESWVESYSIMLFIHEPISTLVIGRGGGGVKFRHFFRKLYISELKIFLKIVKDIAEARIVAKKAAKIEVADFSHIS